MVANGATGDGITPNDSVLAAVLSGISSPGAVLFFSSGNFLFNHSLQIPSNIQIKGDGPAVTTFTLSLGGSGHGIRFDGSLVAGDTSSLSLQANKDSLYIQVLNASLYAPGDWIRLIQNDSAYITSAWAWHTVGQILQITDIRGDSLFLASPLRMSYSMTNKPYICRINPIKNSGIQCLKIVRTDNTAPEQTSHIYMSYAVNCYVSGIESTYGNFSHLEAEFSSNILISKSYFHHAFEYGDGGRGYGVILHFTTGECCVEDNAFEHLRHSMLVQAGANGNVFAYNYSSDPYWTTFPTNSAGELVLHGNYVYANLFEQNICQNIVIDNSHGPNGPYNTFFRNRAGGYGIFFSAANSPDQNLIGNEIPNTSFPYSLVNYTILGSGHFVHGNNNKGTIVPAGTTTLPDLSYAYTQKPDFIPVNQWGGIGTPQVMGSNGIPAFDRYNAGNIFYNACGVGAVGFTEPTPYMDNLLILPNPFSQHIEILTPVPFSRIRVFTSCGQLIYTTHNPALNHMINTRSWPAGMYVLKVGFSHKQEITEKLIRIP